MGSRDRGLKNFGLSAAVAAVLLLALPAIAAADTLTVNDDDAPGDVGPGGTCGPRDHPTINDALSVVADGDTIRVCAGTYDEFAHFATPNVTMLGAQAGVDARTRSAPEAEESVVSADSVDGIFALAGENVVVDGFTITGNPSGPAVSPFISTTIENNIMADTSGGVIGDALDATIRRNRFTDTEGVSGVHVGLDTADFTEIDDNLFEGAAFAAIIVGSDSEAGEDITISDNESTGAGGIGVLGGFGIQIARNVITDPPESEIGAIALLSVVDADVTRNLVENPGELTGAITLFNFIAGPSVFVDITRNTLLGDGDDAGILLLEESHEGILDVHFNRIAGHEVGMFVDDTNSVDATDNWWGCNEGPEDEDCDFVDFDDMTSDVDFDPWLTLAASADPDSISAGGQTSAITADLLTNSDGDTVPADFPNGSQVDFATDLGTVDPLFDLTQDALATTTLTSGPDVGTANVESTLDNETVATPVEITDESEPPACTERIDGTAQNDRLTGTDASELIRGRGGRDKVNGASGDDCVKGGAGPDKVIGGPGEDRARGGAGDDVVKARDGETDVVRCGAGDDVAKVNPGDNVKGCEEVKR